MFAPKGVGGLSSGAGGALLGSRGCPATSSLALVSVEVTAPTLGTGATFILGSYLPGVPGCDVAARGAGDGGDPGSELGWDVGGGGGRGLGMTGDIFGVGEHKQLKPALSACYKPAISRAEIWQSVNTGSKTTWRSEPGTHLR